MNEKRAKRSTRMEWTKTYETKYGSVYPYLSGNGNRIYVVVWKSELTYTLYSAYTRKPSAMNAAAAVEVWALQSVRWRRCCCRCCCCCCCCMDVPITCFSIRSIRAHTVHFISLLRSVWLSRLHFACFTPSIGTEFFRTHMHERLNDTNGQKKRFLYDILRARLILSIFVCLSSVFGVYVWLLLLLLLLLFCFVSYRILIEYSIYRHLLIHATKLSVQQNIIRILLNILLTFTDFLFIRSLLFSFGYRFVWLFSDFLMCSCFCSLLFFFSSEFFLIQSQSIESLSGSLAPFMFASHRTIGNVLMKN